MEGVRPNQAVLRELFRAGDVPGLLPGGKLGLIPGGNHRWCGKGPTHSYARQNASTKKQGGVFNEQTRKDRAHTNLNRLEYYGFIGLLCTQSGHLGQGYNLTTEVENITLLSVLLCRVAA